MECHNDLLRRVLHSVHDQLAQDGINTRPRCILAESRLANTCMISIRGASPYQALLGRQPPVLEDFEPAPATALADAESGDPGVSRHSHWLRAAAV